MNKLNGTVSKVVSNGNLSIVQVRINNVTLKTVLITDANNREIAEGQPIDMIFKETEVVIAKGDTSLISLQNKLPGTIVAMETGKLLCRLHIRTSVGIIVSIITVAAVEQLNLKNGDEVTAMIKTNETLLSY